ncbi:MULTISPECIES: hypothetical protein [Pantoea]|nr:MULTISPECIES: hypothetical protein [Pantoea]
MANDLEHMIVDLAIALIGYDDSHNYNDWHVEWLGQKRPVSSGATGA